MWPSVPAVVQASVRDLALPPDFVHRGWGAASLSLAAELSVQSAERVPSVLSASSRAVIMGNKATTHTMSAGSTDSLTPPPSQTKPGAAMGAHVVQQAMLQMPHVSQGPPFSIAPGGMVGEINNPSFGQQLGFSPGENAAVTRGSNGSRCSCFCSRGSHQQSQRRAAEHRRCGSHHHSRDSGSSGHSARSQSSSWRSPSSSDGDSCSSVSSDDISDIAEIGESQLSCGTSPAHTVVVMVSSVRGSVDTVEFIPTLKK